MKETEITREALAAYLDLLRDKLSFDDYTAEDQAAMQEKVALLERMLGSRGVAWGEQREAWNSTI